MDTAKEMILKQLPRPFAQKLSAIPFAELEEIRFRVNRPIMLYFHSHTAFITAEGNLCASPSRAATICRNDLDALFAALCGNSVYAHLNDVTDGFITLHGGHRVGISGRCIMKDNEISNVTAVSGINIRIARPYSGCASGLALQLRTNGTIYNTLLIAPPQCGKTTMLRDLARIFSADFKITVVDERSEIAGSYNGVPQFDIGMQTDVLDRFPKARGMLFALRSLSPDILLTDELGAPSDLNALREVSRAGCRLIASVHGTSVDDIQKTRPELLSFFDAAVLLARRNHLPCVSEVISLR